MTRATGASALCLAVITGAGCGRSATPHASTAIATTTTTVAAAPTPTPTATPPEPDVNASDCSDPSPPPLARVDVKILIVGASRLILDATPIVGPDPDYCEKIGYTDRRRFCPPRPEGNPERGACDDLLVGRALDTNRYGPTWTVNGENCVNYAKRMPFCNNHPDNQFLVEAFGAGMYEACSRSNVCGGVQVQ